MFIVTEYAALNRYTSVYEFDILTRLQHDKTIQQTDLYIY